ncbi:hypothetical protein HZ326_21109 [Fusarium oxysporum f. sp. albedinis]|nr:hypothetical protein HZ326_21109 [Fusarium oxysporum f. sp. albedinis]
MADRFLHIRLLLYRPLFVQLCQRMNAQAKTCSGEKPGDFSRTPSQLYDAFAEKCSTTCIEIAQALIDHIDNASKITYTGSPWYSCYCICLSCCHSATFTNLGGHVTISSVACPSIIRTCTATFDGWKVSQDLPNPLAQVGPLLLAVWGQSESLTWLPKRQGRQMILQRQMPKHLKRLLCVTTQILTPTRPCYSAMETLGSLRLPNLVTWSLNQLYTTTSSGPLQA